MKSNFIFKLAFETALQAKIRHFTAYRKVPIIMGIPAAPNNPLDDRFIEAVASFSFYQPLDLFGSRYYWNFERGLQISEIPIAPPVPVEELWF